MFRQYIPSCWTLDQATVEPCLSLHSYKRVPVKAALLT